MDERAILFANVLDQPADDAARLVLADWLQEHGEEPLGRFLRAGVVAARFSAEEFVDDPDYYAALAETAAVAKTGEPAPQFRRPQLVLGWSTSDIRNTKCAPPCST